MKKLSLSQIAGMSCMIFAIFFGAGNIVFPTFHGTTGRNQCTNRFARLCFK